MIYVQVKGGKVVTRAVFDEPMPDDWQDRESWQRNDEAQIGWSFEEGEFTAPPLPIISDEEQMRLLENQFSAAIQSHLDATARERRYDGIQTAITYRNDPNPQFAAEGEALFEWRSACWTYSTTELDKVKAGQREIPSVEDFIAELPVFEWPIIGDTNE